jgi:hypothetical protein
LQKNKGVDNRIIRKGVFRKRIKCLRFGFVSQYIINVILVHKKKRVFIIIEDP